MRLIRVTAVAAVAVLALSGTTTARAAASDHPAARAAAPEQKRCSFMWFNVDKRPLLTAVSDAVRLGSNQRWSPELHVLRRGAVAVTGVALPSPQEAIKALSRHVRKGLRPMGEKYPDVDSGANRFSGPGRYVEYAAIKQLVDADFRYSCGGYGHVTTWTEQYVGLAECRTSTQDDQHVADVALELACP